MALYQTCKAIENSHFSDMWQGHSSALSPHSKNSTGFKSTDPLDPLCVQFACSPYEFHPTVLRHAGSVEK